MTPEQRAAQMAGIKKVVDGLTSPRAKRFFFTALGLVLLGIWVGTMAPAPRRIDEGTRDSYETALMRAREVPGYHEALADYHHQQQITDEAKVWFWRFRSSHRAEVNRRQAVADRALARYKKKDDERYQIIRAAKHEVGIWSDYGIQEVREQFWQTFQEGKDMAKRMTFYDVMFSMFDRRDEDSAAFIMKWALRILSNYTIGMFISVVRFIFQLGYIIWEYSPNFFSGSLFFIVASFAALSIIGAFLLLIYSSCVGCCLFLSNQSRQERRQAYQRVPDRYHAD